VFPHQDLAIGQTFRIAVSGTTVEIDPALGKVPLPFDLLRAPGPQGKLTPLAACTFAQGTLDAMGQCSQVGATGFAQLDGFSTTGAILAPTSTLVQVSTVTPSTVQLWDLSNPTLPVRVDPSTYITEPCELASSCAAGALSPVIALQPAGATQVDPTSVFRTRPLKDATDYAVVISRGVLDKSGRPLARGTVASVLLFESPLVDVSGLSQLQGIDDSTARSLEVMRQQLQPVLAAVGQTGIAAADVALAYTFRTQSIFSTAVKLAALPYAAAPSKFEAVTAETPGAAFTRYGLAPGVPRAAIGEVLEARVATLDLLDPATGAFHSDPTQATLERIEVLISIPVAPAKNAMGLTPLVIFRHGLGGGRADMLTVANTFAASGVIVAAIDAAKHGDRSLCTSGTTTTQLGNATVPVCADGMPCVTRLPPGAQGDLAPPGACAGGLFYRPVSASCATPGACPGYDPRVAGIAVVSGNYLVSANFFRTRDTLRQDLIDESQLIRVLAAVPPSPIGPSGDPVFDHLLGAGIIIDPTSVGFIGQSLGAISGSADVATNPRVGAAVLNVGGGTVVDVFTNSPAFSGQVNALLESQGIARGTQPYLQFLVVAKMVLDPAEPLNFAGHLVASTLPNLLVVPAVPQAAKRVLAQAAFCDQVVPNPFNDLLAANAGTGPLPGTAGFGGPGTFELFLAGSSPADADFITQGCTSSTRPHWVEHGFFTDWAAPERTSRAQSDAAAFLLQKTEPLGLVISP
jgi:dienelactone hydrolase